MSFRKTCVKYTYDRLPHWTIEIDIYRLSTGEVVHDASVYCDGGRQQVLEHDTEEEAFKWAKEWIINYTNQE